MKSQMDEALDALDERFAAIERAIEESENRVAINTAKAAERTLIACSMMKSINIESVAEWLRDSGTAPTLTEALQSNSVFIGNHLVSWTTREL